MKEPWNLADCIDLYTYIQRESDQHNDREKHSRDRKIFLQALKSRNVESLSHQECLRIWLESRQISSKKADTPPSTGRYAQEAYRALRLSLFFFGLLGGTILAASYFVYTGDTPLNVFQFFTLFIIPQLLLILLFLARKLFFTSANPPSYLLLLLKEVLWSFFTYLAKTSVKKKPHDGKNVKMQLNRQFALHAWPLISASQLFGLAFNIGLILFTLLKIITSDLAFGWQTTLSFGPETLYSIVAAISAPWSWLVSAEIAHPSLEQIEGSRIILKDGIYSMATKDMIAWWPFLLFSLGAYGFMPRVVLVLLSSIISRRTLQKYIHSEECRRITARMTTPLVTTHAPPQQDQDAPEKKHHREGLDKENQSKHLIAAALIPDDIFDSCSDKELQKHLAIHGYILGSRTRIFQDFERDNELIHRIEQKSFSYDEAYVIVVEAWMVPINEQLSFISQVTRAAEGRARAGIYFLGRPHDNGAFLPAEQQDIKIWRDKLADLTQNLTQIN